MTTGMLDRIDTWLLAVLVLVVFLGASEIGLRLARWRMRSDDRGTEDRKALSSVVLGALLGLLALLLAFSFTIVEGRLSARKQLVLEEANAVGTAYLRAELLPAPHRERVQRLLGRYLDVRIAVTADTLEQAIAESERLHQRFWTEAAAVARASPDPIVALFVASLNDVIDLHEERVTVGLYHRLPKPFLWTLLVIGALTLGVLGYNAGLAATRRTALPSLVVIAATTIVLLLIVEMDRPWGGLFRVDHQPLVDARATMSAPSSPAVAGADVSPATDT